VTTESGDKKDGKTERKRQPKWAQVLAIVLSAIASSGITLGARERLIPPATNEQCMAEVVTLKGEMEKLSGKIPQVETRVTVLETKVDAAEKAHQEEVKLRTIVQTLQDAFGPGPVKYRTKPQPE